ncbi:hypothetical protein K449DRAFT_392829 [Hypoxylon sp. EC38]|nr:hypothetical protein K449DRAFT_392829 [Hypoxylon sp. EC38]
MIAPCHRVIRPQTLLTPTFPKEPVPISVRQPVYIDTFCAAKYELDMPVLGSDQQ